MSVCCQVRSKKIFTPRYTRLSTALPPQTDRQWTGYVDIPSVIWPRGEWSQEFSWDNFEQEERSDSRPDPPYLTWKLDWSLQEQETLSRLQSHSARLQMFSRPVKTLAWVSWRLRAMRLMILQPRVMMRTGINCHNWYHILSPSWTLPCYHHPVCGAACLVVLQWVVFLVMLLRALTPNNFHFLPPSASLLSVPLPGPGRALLLPAEGRSRTTSLLRTGDSLHISSLPSHTGASKTGESQVSLHSSLNHYWWWLVDYWSRNMNHKMILTPVLPWPLTDSRKLPYFDLSWSWSAASAGCVWRRAAGTGHKVGLDISQLWDMRVARAGMPGNRHTQYFIDTIAPDRLVLCSQYEDWSQTLFGWQVSGPHYRTWTIP